MPLEIRELTIRAVVNESNTAGESQGSGHVGNASGDGERDNGVDEARIVELAMEQVVKLLKDKDER